MGQSDRVAAELRGRIAAGQLRPGDLLPSTRALVAEFGIAMATAVVSALTGRPVRANVAMTGEITLRGRVLPIGGVKEKILGAHRAGITDIILPKENEKDLEEVPGNVRKKLMIHLVEDMDEVLRIALCDPKPEETAVVPPPPPDALNSTQPQPGALA